MSLDGKRLNIAKQHNHLEKFNFVTKALVPSKISLQMFLTIYLTNQESDSFLSKDSK